MRVPRRGSNPILGLPPRITCTAIQECENLAIGEFVIEPALGDKFLVAAAIDRRTRHLQIRAPSDRPFTEFQREFLRTWGGALVDELLDVEPIARGQIRIVPRRPGDEEGGWDGDGD